MKYLVVPIVGDYPALCMVVELTKEYLNWLQGSISLARKLFEDDERFWEIRNTDEAPILLQQFPKGYDPWERGYDRRGWVLDEPIDGDTTLGEIHVDIERFLWEPEMELLTSHVYVSPTPHLRVGESGLMWSVRRGDISRFSSNVENTTRSISKPYLDILTGFLWNQQ